MVWICHSTAVLAIVQTWCGLAILLVMLWICHSTGDSADFNFTAADVECLG